VLLLIWRRDEMGQSTEFSPFKIVTYLISDRKIHLSGPQQVDRRGLIRPLTPKSLPTPALQQQCKPNKLVLTHTAEQPGESLIINQYQCVSDYHVLVFSIYYAAFTALDKCSSNNIYKTT